jgi:hypothetical protein
VDRPAPSAATELTRVRTDSGAPVAFLTVALTLVVVVGLAILGGHAAAEPAIQAAAPLATRTAAATTTVAAPTPLWITAYVPWPAIPRLESLRATRNGRLPLLLPWVAGARSSHQFAR